MRASDQAGHRETARSVAYVGRMIAAAGLVEGFGHVSARLPGRGFAITSTAPLAAAAPEDVRLLDGALDQVTDHDAALPDTPLEAPLHAAIYEARPEVGGVCRTHSRAAVVWGVRGEVPPLLHGLGLLAGDVRTADEVALVTDAEHGRGLAAALGPAACLLVRGNGAVACGRTPAEAAVRAWFLEERCRLALEAGEGARELEGAEQERRSRWTAAEMPRAWRWMCRRFGCAGTDFDSRALAPLEDQKEEEAHAS